jgi:hypothetical protein
VGRRGVRREHGEDGGPEDPQAAVEVARDGPPPRGPGDGARQGHGCDDPHRRAPVHET